MKQTINVLPSPTFRWLKINAAEVEKNALPKKELEYTAKENEESTLILSGADPDEEPGFKASLTLKRNSVLNIIQVVADAKDTEIIQQVEAFCAENALLKVFWIFIGGGRVYPSLKAELKGKGSSLEFYGAYVAQAGSLLDMNIISEHTGRDTRSSIDVKGVLYEGAKKVFRGTIDFKRGCKGATGNEYEDVLLMDDDVVNQTVPLILCNEEDVAGNHGASVGRIDEELCFYMCSRGLSFEETQKLLLASRVNAVVGRMPEKEKAVIEKKLNIAAGKGEGLL